MHIKETNTLLMEQILKKYEINDQYKNNLMFDKGEEVEDEKEYEKNINNKFLNNKRSFSPESLNNDIIDSNFTLSNNNISQLSDLDENDESVDHSYTESSKLNNLNKSELIHNLNKSKSCEIKTNEESKIKFEEKNNNIIINSEKEMLEINRKNRGDNDQIKILRWIFKSFIKKINGKIKNENLKLNELYFKENNKSNHSILCKSKWKDVILDNSNDNEKNIKNIYENNEKEAIELLEMNFCSYLDIFKEDNLSLFLEEEKENQIKRYKQKKYKEVIEKKEISMKNIQNLEIIKNFVTFYDSNKKGKNNLDNEESSIIREFEERNYKINKEEGFISFIKQIHKEISFDLTAKEKDDINNYIKMLENLFENFDKWFENKKSRKNRKKSKKIFSVNNNYKN